jgi:hypothetical protein
MIGVMGVVAARRKRTFTGDVAVQILAFGVIGADSFCVVTGVEGCFTEECDVASCGLLRITAACGRTTGVLSRA